MAWKKVIEFHHRVETEREIASILRVGKTTVNRDLAYLNKQARENLQNHIHETIPAEYQKALNSLNQVLRMTWSIVGKTEDEKTRLQALALINDVNKYRTELVTNGVIVHDSLQIIQSKMEHLNGNGKAGKVRQQIEKNLNSEVTPMTPQERKNQKLLTVYSNEESNAKGYHIQLFS